MSNDKNIECLIQDFEPISDQRVKNVNNIVDLPPLVSRSPKEHNLIRSKGKNIAALL